MKTFGTLGLALLATASLAAIGCSARRVEIIQEDEPTEPDTTMPGGGRRPSSSSSSSSGGSSGSSSTSSSGSSGGASSSSSGSSGASSSGSTSTCPVASVAASSLPWAAAKALQPNACTTANITSMESWLQANPSATNAQFQSYVQSLSQTCHDCVFTDGNAATWGPVPMSAGSIVTMNIGACFALVSGNAACGKAIQNAFDCELVACADCTTDSALTTCRTQSRSGACAPYVSAIQTSCAGLSSTIDNVCGSLFDSIRAQCVATPTI